MWNILSNSRTNWKSLQSFFVACASCCAVADAAATWFRRSFCRCVLPHAHCTCWNVWIRVFIVCVSLDWLLTTWWSMRSWTATSLKSGLVNLQPGYEQFHTCSAWRNWRNQIPSLSHVESQWKNSFGHFLLQRTTRQCETTYKPSRTSALLWCPGI